MTVSAPSSSSSMLSADGLTVTDPDPISPSQLNWIPSLVTAMLTIHYEYDLIYILVSLKPIMWLTIDLYSAEDI